jgi:hypothetical protein
MPESVTKADGESSQRFWTTRDTERVGLAVLSGGSMLAIAIIGASLDGGFMSVWGLIAIVLAVLGLLLTFVFIISAISLARALSMAKRVQIRFEREGEATAIESMQNDRPLQRIVATAFDVRVVEPASGYGRHKAWVYLKAHGSTDHSWELGLYEWALPCKNNEAFIRTLDELGLLGDVTRLQQDPWSRWPSVRESLLILLVTLPLIAAFVLLA